VRVKVRYVSSERRGAWMQHSDTNVMVHAALHAQPLMEAMNDAGTIEVLSKTGSIL